MMNKNQSHKVGILGFGPTSVFVARAAFDAGYDVTIFATHDRLGTPPGAFWLHWIPDTVPVPLEAENILIEGQGTAHYYTKRQWAYATDPEVWQELSSSFPVAPMSESGYSPEASLNAILPPHTFQIVNNPIDLGTVMLLTDHFDFIFQTFPVPGHFRHQPPLLPFVAASAPAPERYLDDSVLYPNYVRYNGHENPSDMVVREAWLFGKHYLEFPKGLPIDAIQQYAPPGLLTDHTLVELKDLHPDSIPMYHDLKKVYLVGRMAMWDRKFLSHDAYAFTQGVLNG